MKRQLTTEELGCLRISLASLISHNLGSIKDIPRDITKGYLNSKKTQELDNGIHKPYYKGVFKR